MYFDYEFVILIGTIKIKITIKIKKFQLGKLFSHAYYMKFAGSVKRENLNVQIDITLTTRRNKIFGHINSVSCQAGDQTGNDSYQSHSS